MTVQPKARKPREKGAAQTLASIAKMAAQGAESLRREEHRARKDEERIRILLLQYAGPILAMLARVEIPEEDREFLRLKGYTSRKDR